VSSGTYFEAVKVGMRSLNFIHQTCRSTFVHLRRGAATPDSGKFVAFPSIPDGSHSRLVGQSSPLPRSRPRKAFPGDFVRRQHSLPHDSRAERKADQISQGIETERGFKEIPEEEIIKGYEHTKGHHVLIKPEELDELKLEAKAHHRHGEVR
jgi:hypothetical protein